MQENTSPLQSIPPQPATTSAPQPTPGAPASQPTTPPTQTITQQVQTTSTVQPKSSRLIFIVIALILVALLGGLAFAYVKYGKMAMNNRDEVVDIQVREVLPPVSDIDVVVATPVPGETTPAVQNMNLADWETYTDQENKFSFQYPADLRVDRNGAATMDVASHVGPMLADVGKLGSTQEFGTELHDGFNFTMAKIPLKGKSLEQIATEDIDSSVKSVGAEILKPQSPMTVAGRQGITYTIRGLGEFTYVLLPYDTENLFLIIYSAPDPSNQGYQQTIDQMLVTLKFL